MMRRCFLAALGMLALTATFGGCSGDTGPTITPEEKAQVKTEPTAEKSAAGKPATTPKASAD